MKAGVKISVYVWVWLFALIVSFFIELESCYTSSRADYDEAVNRLADCKLLHFATRYPKDCAKVILEPPRMFFFSWASSAMKQVNVCGPVSCDQMFTLKGLSVAIAMAMGLRAAKLYV